jgi:hypothetical protein
METRCAKIAELLVKGKKGHELDAAIQEFDRHHVPEVVTRFEAPITAGMYRRRRSSSAPVVVDTELREHFVPSLSSSTTTASRPPQHVRSASSQPTRYSSPAMETPSSPFTDLDPEAFYDAAFSSSCSSPESYSFPSTPSPSFDFGTFSFNQSVNNTPMYGDDGHLSEHNNNNALGMLMTQPPRALQRDLSSLSIDTSPSFVDDWSAAPSPAPSSPSSSSSPSSYDSPSNEDAFAAFAGLEQFDLELNNYSQSTLPELQLYSSYDAPPPSPDLTPSTTTFEYPYPHHDHISKHHFSSSPYEPSKQHTAANHSDADFTAFMASLPSYNSM